MTDSIATAESSKELNRQIDKPIQRLRSKPIQRRVDKPVQIQVPRSGSGRQQHDEKVTFYCTGEEFLALERARLALREYGLSVDRGRIIREALSITLDDLDRAGADAIIVERLAGQP